MNGTKPKKYEATLRPFKCDWCGETIPRGSFYYRWCRIHEGSPTTTRMHGECMRWYKAILIAEGCESFESGEHERPKR